MADYDQYPKQGVGAELASYTNNWPGLRGKIAGWNSGASDEKPTVESLGGFYGGVTDKEELLYNELLKQFLQQALRDRTSPGGSIFDDPAVKGAASGPSRYTE